MSLTINAIRSMYFMNGSADNPSFCPTLQLLHLKKIKQTTHGAEHSWKVVISDGQYYIAGMLVNQIHPKVHSGEIAQFAIITVHEFEVNTLPSGQKIIILLGADKVINPGTRLGNPVDISKAPEINLYVRSTFDVGSTMDELDGATNRLKLTVDDHQSSLSAEMQKLDDEEKRIRDRLNIIEERKHQNAAENGIPDVSEDDLIEINAGGKIIAAKRGVLTQRKGTRLEALFSGRWEQKLQRDNSGRIFLDVNPKAFRAIVDWLNMMSISSEDDCPEPPTVDVENEDILKHQMRLFFAQLTNIDSKIIRSAKEAEIIHNWLNEDNSDGELHLLYRSSRDGLTAEEFHKTCDNKGRTFVLIETTEGVVGGYSNSDWDGEIGSFYRADKAFIFVLSGFDLRSPCKRKLKNAGVKCAILGTEEYGPAFGGGSDLKVDEESALLF